jgi:hypothetical protein
VSERHGIMLLLCESAPHPSYASCKLNIPLHDGDALGMDLLMRAEGAVSIDF